MATEGMQVDTPRLYIELVQRGTPSTRTAPPCGFGISTALTGGGNQDPELSEVGERRATDMPPGDPRGPGIVSAFPPAPSHIG